jgi:SAM-dependent methyltransferase
MSGTPARLRRVLTDRLTVPQRQRWRRRLRRPRWGNLRRLRPLSAKFGFDRGTPIDRHHTDAFMAAHADAIRGVVGEIADDPYARRFGGRDVERVEIIDIDPSNSRATIIADLAEEGALPDAAFDCLIVTQTLQYIADPAAALRSCAAALRPGGTLLLAVPALTAHDSIEPDDVDFWRFWPAGLRHLLDLAFPGAVVALHSAGNLVTTIAFLHGISAEELRAEELALVDPRYPVVILARVERG